MFLNGIQMGKSLLVYRLYSSFFWAMERFLSQSFGFFYYLNKKLYLKLHSLNLIFVRQLVMVCVWVISLGISLYLQKSEYFLVYLANIYYSSLYLQHASLLFHYSGLGIIEGKM